MSDDSSLAEGLIATIREPLVVLDADGRVRQANRAFHHTFAIAADGAEGRLIYELNGGQWDFPELRDLLEGLGSDDSEAEDVRIRHDFARIGPRSLVLNARRVRGGPDLIVLAIEDITPRVLAQEAAQAREARFRFLSDLDEASRSLGDPARVMATAAEHLGRHLNATRCAYADVEADNDRFTIRHDYVARGHVSTVGSYRLDQFGSKAVAAMRSGQTLVVRDVSAELAPEDGADMFGAIGIGAVICCPLVKEGHLTAMMAVHQAEARDWSPDEVRLLEVVAERSWAHIERTRADRELRAEEGRFRALADNIAQFAWMTEPDGHIFWYNRRWFDYTGTTLDAMKGWGWKAVHHPEHVGRVVEKFARHLAEGTTWEDTFPLRGREGQYRWFLSRAQPIRDEGGRVLLWCGTNTDVTEHLAAEQERERLLKAAETARGDAEAANRMKDEFLATLSHELRTPLNAILGWSRLLQSGPLDADDLNEGIAAIGRNAVAQAQIVEDLLDVSRIISGNFRLEVRRLNIHEVIEAAVASVMPALQAKGIRLHKVLDSLAGPVSGDPARLQQVLWNLLSNAAKFTPAGGQVQVLLERVNSHIEISVIDTGIGIRPEFLPHVFDRFRQADSSTTRRHGGLGLGLAIVKQLIELHGGTVRAKSPGEGQGSTFLITLPIVVVHPEAPAARPTPPRNPDPAPDEAQCLAGLRILVVDDEPDARQLIRRVLEGVGAQVALAASGAEALGLIDSFGPAVLLSDIGMPEQDGYDLIRRVRSRHPARDLPAAALTAFARAEDRRRALLAGFQTHVAKPVDPAELVAVVASLAGRTG